MRSAELREYQPDEILCRQGERADRAFLLKRGSLRGVVLSDRDMERADDARILRGRDLELHMEPDTLLGVDGALLGKFSDNLVAAEPTVVAEIPLDARGLISMVVEDIQFGLSMARALARKLVAVNRSLGGAQREAARFMREFQGLCTDFYGLIQRIQDDAEGEDDVLRALSVAKRSWAYYTGEAGGAEVTKQTGKIMARVVDENDAFSSQHRLRKGDLLCRRGDPGKSVYILISGRLSVRVGHELYGMVRPGETVGEISVLLGEEEPRRIADIQAEEPSVVGLVPGDMFPSLVESKPKLLVNTCKLLAMRTRSFQQLVADSEGALQAVMSRFGGEKASFLADIEQLQGQLDGLIEEYDFPLHMEHEQLSRMADRWQAKLDELSERLKTAPV